MNAENLKWIFVGGMIRSGSTLQYQILSTLVTEKLGGSSLGFVEAGEIDAFLAAREADPTTRFPCVIKSHVCTVGIRERLAGDSALAFYTHRDIRDVVVSGSRNFDVPVDDFISGRFIDEAVCEGFLWAANPAVAVSDFQGLVGDPCAWIAEMLEILGIPDDSGEAAARLAGEFSLERQRARLKSAEFREAGDFSVDPSTLLHRNHIDRAAIGGWRECLAPAQVREIETRAADWMLARACRFESLSEAPRPDEIVRSLRVRMARYLQEADLELTERRRLLQEQAAEMEMLRTSIESERARVRRYERLAQPLLAIVNRFRSARRKVSPP